MAYVVVSVSRCQGSACREVATSVPVSLDLSTHLARTAHSKAVTWRLPPGRNTKQALTVLKAMTLVRVSYNVHIFLPGPEVRTEIY